MTKSYDSLNQIWDSKYKNSKIWSDWRDERQFLANKWGKQGARIDLNLDEERKNLDISQKNVKIDTDDNK